MENEAASNLRLATTLLLRGINTYKPPLTPAIFEFDDAGDFGEKRIVAADADIGARLEFRASLANQDGAAQHRLAAEAFDSQALSRRVASVA
jgi:hypothetical protein